MATTVKVRNRRSATQLIADLKAKRNKLAERLAVMDAKIAKAEARYEKSLRLAEFSGIPSEQLLAQFEETRRQQKLLRAALKAKRR